MSFDPLWLFLSLIPGAIGSVLIIYGRKHQRWPQMVTGLVLMVYPYFATTITSLIGVGVLIGAACWWAIRSEW